MENKKYTLSDIKDALSTAVIELTGSEPSNPNPGSIYTGRYYLYQQILSAKRQAETNGGGFWVENQMPTERNAEYTPPYVAGILDELRTRFSQDNRIGDRYRKVGLNVTTVDRAEVILFQLNEPAENIEPIDP